MTDMYVGIFIIFFVSIASYAIFTVVKYSIKKKLPKSRKVYLNRLLKTISKKESSKEKIIDYDKLYHKILVELGYNGTFGDILKLEPNEIGNINKVWELHKLRNKLVHDFDLIDEIFLKRKEEEYYRELFFILK
ncbi:MAG: hypothetical protein PHH98_04700 [Candidatus Gracilibacteria bacterium]|nr:hypothetical protein [Candidatus Gracilibacteria bacterium]